MNKLAKLLESFARVLSSAFVTLNDLGKVIVEAVEENIRVYWISILTIGKLYRQIWQVRRILLIIAICLHFIALTLISCGLHWNNGLFVAIGGLILLFNWVALLGLFELTGHIIKVLITAAESNTNLYDKLVRVLAPGGTSGREVGMKLVDLSAVKETMAMVKRIRTLILPILVTVTFMVVMPSWWTAGVAVGVLFISFVLAYYASTYNYDMSRARRRLFITVTYLIPVFIALSLAYKVVPEIKKPISQGVTLIRAFLGGNGLDDLNKNQQFVYLTPTTKVSLLDTLANKTDTTLSPGDKFALIGITEDEFRTGQIPSEQFLSVTNGLQSIMKIHRPNKAGILEFKNETLLVQANSYEIYSEYEKRTGSEKESEEAVAEADVARRVVTAAAGNIKWVNDHEAVIMINPQKTFPTHIFLAENSRFFYYPDSKGCSYISGSTGSHPIPASGLELMAYDPKTHLVVRNDTKQRKKIKLVITTGGTVNS